MQEIKVPTEIFSRVSGYYRPVQQFNKGKREEFSERRYLKVPDSGYRASTRNFNTRIQ